MGVSEETRQHFSHNFYSLTPNPKPLPTWLFNSTVRTALPRSKSRIMPLAKKGRVRNAGRRSLCRHRRTHRQCRRLCRNIRRMPHRLPLRIFFRVLCPTLPPKLHPCRPNSRRCNGLGFLLHQECRTGSIPISRWPLRRDMPLRLVTPLRLDSRRVSHSFRHQQRRCRPNLRRHQGSLRKSESKRSRQS